MRSKIALLKEKKPQFEDMVVYEEKRNKTLFVLHEDGGCNIQAANGGQQGVLTKTYLAECENLYYPPGQLCKCVGTKVKELHLKHAMLTQLSDKASTLSNLNEEFYEDPGLAVHQRYGEYLRKLETIDVNFDNGLKEWQDAMLEAAWELASEQQGTLQALYKDALLLVALLELGKIDLVKIIMPISQLLSAHMRQEKYVVDLVRQTIETAYHDGGGRVKLWEKFLRQKDEASQKNIPQILAIIEKEFARALAEEKENKATSLIGVNSSSWEIKLISPILPYIGYIGITYTRRSPQALQEEIIEVPEIVAGLLEKISEKSNGENNLEILKIKSLNRQTWEAAEQLKVGQKNLSWAEAVKLVEIAESERVK